MKILVVANTSWYAWNFRANLMKACAVRGHEIVVIAPPDAYSSRFAEIGARFVPVRLWAKSANPIKELWTLFSFIRAYRRERADLAFQYTIKPNLYGSLAGRLCGTACVSNVTGLGEVFVTETFLSKIVRCLYRFAFARARRVFFQNGDDSALFLGAGLVKPEVTALLPGSGVDLTHFTPRKKNGGPFTFLFVGRLLRAKGVEEFIQAARIVKSKAGIPVECILLGAHDPADPHMADAKTLAEAVADGTVIAPGPTDDVRVWLDRADCVVLPSYYREGIPRSLLEAAASAKPLIAADSVGTREPVEEGVNGYLCRPRDGGDLAERMLRMVALAPEEREKMGQASRRLAETRFDEQIVLNAYLDIIDNFVVQ